MPLRAAPNTIASSVLLDGHGTARAILETVAVEIIPFDKVSEEFAFAYGERDRSLAWFQQEIGRWYKDPAARSGERLYARDANHLRSIRGLEAVGLRFRKASTAGLID